MSLVTPPTNYQFESFDPRSLGDCQLWFDAADTSSITTSGNQVTAWRNKGRISVNAVPNTGVCTSGNTTMSGLNYINCPAGTDLAFTCALNTQARTWFAVIRNRTQINAASAPQYIGIVNATAGSQDALIAYRVSGDNYGLYNGPNGVAVRVGTTTIQNPFGNIIVYNLINGATGNRISVNGLAATLSTNTAASGYSTASLKYLINTSSYNTSNDFFEILFFSRVLDSTEFQLVEGYLAWKWGFGLSESFVPTNIPDCKFWLEGEDYTKMTLSGTTITSWTDRVSNVTLVPANGTLYGPTLTSGNARNRGAFFNNSTANSTWTNTTRGLYYKNLSTPAFTLSSRSVTIIIVGNGNSNVSFRSMLQMWSGSADGTAVPGMNVYMQPFSASEGVHYKVDNGSAVVYQSVGPGTNQVTATYLIVKNGGVNSDNIIKYAGRDTTVTTYTNSGYNSGYTYPIHFIALASSNSQADFGDRVFSGGINEVLIYDRAISDEEQVMISTYLSRKYAASDIQTSLKDSFPPNYLYMHDPPTTRQFIPRDISNSSGTPCTLWLDAADSSTITLSGSNVTQWRDKSGQVRNVTPSGTGITYSNNAIVFAGTGCLTGTTASFLQNSSNGTWSAFAVFLATTFTGSNPRIFNYDPLPNRVAQFLLVEAGTLRAIGFTTGAGAYTAIGPSVVINTRYLVGAVNDTSNITAYVNGVAGTAVAHTASSVASNTSFTIGGYSASADRLTGSIFEVLCFAGPVSTVQRQQIEGYLAWKWGLQGSLPSTHPFYYSASTLSLPPSYTARMNELRFQLTVHFWLDLSLLSKITISGSLFGVVARTGTAFGNNSSTVSCGTYVQNIENGTMPAALIGSADIFRNINALSVGSTTLSFFLVYRINTGATLGGRIASFGSAGTIDTGNELYFSISYSTTRAFVMTRNATTLNVGTSPGLDQFHVMSVIFNGSTCSGFFDGGAASASVATTTTFGISSVQFGRNIDNTSNILGNIYIAEAFLVQFAASTQQRLFIEGYLGWKYRSVLDKFPATHPYKYVSP
jgi:hypothetical protein